MNFYRIVDGLLLVSILLTPAQTNNKIDNKPETTAIEKSVEKIYKQKKKDSIVKATDKFLDNSIEYSKNGKEVIDELAKSKTTEQQLFDNFVNKVNLVLIERGRKEKAIFRSDLKQKLKEGEIFLAKDSVCTNYKRKFLSKKRCVKWEYSWYLVDKEGSKEKLW